MVFGGNLIIFWGLWGFFFIGIGFLVVGVFFFLSLGFEEFILC